MKVNVNALGHSIEISPNSIGRPNDVGIIDKAKIQKGIELLKEYKKGKQNLEARIIDNEKWYKMRHWDLIRKKAANQDPEPTTAWLFNALANKHADAMDNYPAPNILPREQSDEGEAKSLTDIVPLVIDKSDIDNGGFEETYDLAWWDKLKNGTAAYGVFWNPELENGLGDIEIPRLSMLNIFWEPGKKKIQRGRAFFIVDLVDDDMLEETYPFLKGKLQNKVINIAEYAHDDSIDNTKKSLVVDWYYKKKQEGKKCLHLIKFVGETKIWASEEDDLYANTGIYDDGAYPVVFDVLFPEEDSPAGFGYIDVMKNPQMYIDKLDQIIDRNALQSGKRRFFIKDTGGVNEEEFANWSLDFVHVAGSLSDENIKPIEVPTLDAFIGNHQQNKINELKETSGNRDFNSGGSSGGVTAAAAIASLQEAGNKLSRDMNKGSYRAFTKLVYMCIERIRQFYDEERKFRIEGPKGKVDYIGYSNINLKEQLLPPVHAEEGMYPDPEMLAQGQTIMVPDPNYQPKYRKPVFDIKVKPQKSNPFSRMAQNEMAKEMYIGGFFDPTRAEQALIALELMDFEGKEKVVEKVSNNQMLLQQMQQMKMTMDKMAMVIEQITGRSMMGENVEQSRTSRRASTRASTRANPSMRGVNGAMQNSQTSYAEKIAGNASANVGGGMNRG
jgi:hypothetical protein